ncbi:MAG: hypothetical protein CMB16_00480 [Euryarchaeota archaeon]|jgi:hypothetical protein|nr:hypothetical protein [Euryarchaeota archaeon]|tara:strand:+ start:2462 stop:2761 length:300 start_codon:yes stop_codon:yes gene_type:complete
MKKKRTKRNKIDVAFLNDVPKIIKERGKTYGDIKKNHQDIAKGWEVILDKDKIEPYQVAMCLDWLKTVRLIETPDHLDSLKDKVGYVITHKNCLDDKDT